LNGRERGNAIAPSTTVNGVVDIALLQRLGEGRRLGIRGSVTRGSARYAKTLRKNITRKRLARACEGNSAEAQQPTNTRSHACEGRIGAVRGKPSSGREDDALE
jgi:hypothetical protein